MTHNEYGAGLRVGLIGAGFIAGIHARAARAAGGELVAIASSSPERARSAAVELGFARAADSARALLDRNDLDVVHVCSPNGSHAAFAGAALESGKNVVCEKPLATSLEDATALVARAQQAKLVAVTPFAYRYHPMVQEARARIASGEAGPIASVRGQYLQDWRLTHRAEGWWVDVTQSGPSRAFADIGSHLVDLIEFVSGERLVEISARTRMVEPASPEGRLLSTEDLAAVHFVLSGGALGTLFVSQMALGHKNDLRWEISGTSAAVSWAQEDPDTLTVATRDGVTTLARDSSRLAPSARRLSTVPAGHPIGYQDTFNSLVADAYSAIRGETVDGLPGFEDAARAVRITSAVLESTASRAWVTI